MFSSFYCLHVNLCIKDKRMYHHKRVLESDYDARKTKLEDYHIPPSAGLQASSQYTSERS
jgi:hypothetical protein